MLRNALTIGFNDALISHGNKWYQTGNLDLWKEMKQGEFPDLVWEENDLDLSSLIIDKVKKLIYTTDIEHVASNCIGRIGNPVAYQVI